MTRPLVLASNNRGKLAEFDRLLAPLGFVIQTQAALNISEAEEPHFTFIENALTKARHAARESGLPALADDSGICVPALGGAPGVLSARYADDPQPVIADARWHGEIIDRPRGQGGFGYDPHFWLPSLNKTAAELTSEEKNQISHRSQALRMLISQLV